MEISRICFVSVDKLHGLVACVKSHQSADPLSPSRFFCFVFVCCDLFVFFVVSFFVTPQVPHGTSAPNVVKHMVARVISSNSGSRTHMPPAQSV